MNVRPEYVLVSMLIENSANTHPFINQSTKGNLSNKEKVTPNRNSSVESTLVN